MEGGRKGGMKGRREEGRVQLEPVADQIPLS